MIKKGDWVICVRKEAAQTIQVGELYKVKEVRTSEGAKYLRFDDPYLPEYHSYSIDKFKPSQYSTKLGELW